MSTNIIQTSFASGELAPSIYAHTDLAKYHTGLALCRNFFVDYRSGVSSRSGTKFIIQCLQTGARLIPFQYSTIASYIIEFGNFYCRFISNGATVLETGFAITAADNNTPAHITVPGNNFAPGDWIFISGIVGETGLNGQYLLVSSISGSVITLYTVNNVRFNGSNRGTYISGGIASRVYTLTSPYAVDDLPLLKFTQSASVMTITHPNYAPYNLKITNPTSWAFTAINFNTPVNPPTGLTTATSTAGSANFAFEVTSVDAQGNESAPSAIATLASAVNIYGTAGTVTVNWIAPVAGDTPVQYNVYAAELSFAGAVPTGAAFGFLGQTNATATSFSNSSIEPNFVFTPPIPTNPFAAGNNPSCNCFFQQRQCFAASTANPTTFWMGQPGGFTPTSANFNVSNPIEPDDAITGTIVSLQVNAIKWMLPMPGGLVIGTAQGAWQVVAGSGQNATVAVTPENVTAVPQAFNGASDLPPIVVNYDILYVQARGAIVRDLAYNIYVNIYTGTDISVLSNHLFFGFQMVQWAYAEEPFKTIWIVRNDGTLLSLTYVKEQEIYGWAHHDTLGTFQSVASVIEGQFNAVYVVVERYIGGEWVQMIERFDNRQFTYGAEDAWCVDCGVQSSLVFPAANLTITGTTPAPAPTTIPLGATGSTLVATGTGTFAASVAVFSAGNVGQILRVGGGIATITSYISPTQIVGAITQPITQVLPNDPNATPLPATQGNWSLTPQFTTFTGLDYLNGQTVSINADGGVVTPQVVTNGSITLSQPASKVTVGLAYTAQLQTMPLDTGEPTIQGKRKKVAALNIPVNNARGIYAGRTFSSLVPMKELTANQPLGQPIPLITGMTRVVMDPLWDVPGQICLQITDLMPATILGVVPEILVGDTGK